MARLPQVHFRLRNATGKKPGSVALFFDFNKQRLTYPAGVSISADDWNKDRERIKVNNSTEGEHLTAYNDLLDRMERCCMETYRNLRSRGQVVTVETLRAALDKVINNKTGQNRFHSLLDEFIGNKVTNNGKLKRAATIKTYSTLKWHIMEYEFIKGVVLELEAIDTVFVDSYIKYLGERSRHKSKLEQFYSDKIVRGGEYKNLRPNSIKKDISILKVILREAHERGLTESMEYIKRKFTINREKTEHIYLNRSDLNALERLNLENDGQLRRVRDLFLLACAIGGQRISDFSKLRSGNLVQMNGAYYLNIKQEKTGELQKIKMTDEAIAILEKYGNNVDRLTIDKNGRHISGVQFNRLIKKVCYMAGLTDKGRLVSKPDLETWELVTSKTARKTFVTNCYKGGVELQFIMSMTGHTTEKSLRAYISASKTEMSELAAERINKINNPLLKAVG